MVAVLAVGLLDGLAQGLVVVGVDDGRDGDHPLHRGRDRVRLHREGGGGVPACFSVKSLVV